MGSFTALRWVVLCLKCGLIICSRVNGLFVMLRRVLFFLVMGFVVLVWVIVFKIVSTPSQLCLMGVCEKLKCEKN